MGCIPYLNIVYYFILPAYIYVCVYTYTLFFFFSLVEDVVKTENKKNHEVARRIGESKF